jgi:hypothetical protein
MEEGEVRNSRWRSPTGGHRYSESEEEMEEGEEDEEESYRWGGTRGRGRGRRDGRGPAQELEGRAGKRARKRKGGKGGMNVGKYGPSGGEGKYGPGGGGDTGLSAEEEEAKRRRQARFDDRRWRPRTVGRSTNVSDFFDGREAPGEGGFDFREVKAVVGSCQEVEKEYFRLNEVPDPASVRPEPVLRQALARLLRRFHALPPLQSAREADYKEYLWTQFKAIRQDLLIQNLKNAFAVEVYEAHARVALACNDLNEYNQCQTQLMELYKEADLPPEALAHVRDKRVSKAFWAPSQGRG